MSHKTDVTLEKKINTFVEEKRIPRKELEYKWPPTKKTPNEKDVIQKFADFKTNLDTALSLSGSDDAIDDCLVNIVWKWGHVKLPRGKKYCVRYRSLLKELHAHQKNFSAFEFPRTQTIFCKINPLCPVSCTVENDPLTRLSAWTKVLAVYDQNRFWIYDSRVAIALSFVDHSVNWFIPSANDQKGKHPQLVNLKRRIEEKRGDSLSPEDSYAVYLRRMGELDKPCHIEKMLFMLGGFLGNKCTDRDNQFLQHEFDSFWSC